MGIWTRHDFNVGAINVGYQLNDLLVMPTGELLFTMIDIVFDTGNTKAAVIMKPDSYGSYTSNVTWEDVGPMLEAHWGGHLLVLNDGTIYISGSHPVSIYPPGAGGEYSAEIFDPVTRTWIYDPLTDGVGISDHSPVCLDETGNIHGVRAADNPTNSFASHWYQPGTNRYRDKKLGLVEYPIRLQPAGDEEAGVCLLPDGTILAAKAGANYSLNPANAKLSRIYVPALNNESKSYHYQEGAHEVRSIPYDFATSNNAPRSSGQVTEDMWRWRYFAAYYTASMYNILNEAAPIIWMPKIQRAVYINANGELLCFDPVSETFEVRAVLDETAADNFDDVYVGTVSMEHAGKSLRELIYNMFVVDRDVNATVTDINASAGLYIKHTDGTYAKFTGALTIPGISAEQLRFSSISLPSGAANARKKLVGGELVYTQRPIRTMIESEALILPNGDLLFLTTREDGYWGYDTKVHRWDGISPHPEDITPLGPGINEVHGFADATVNVYGNEESLIYWRRLRLLPTGQVALAEAVTVSPPIVRMYIWDPDTDEAIPDINAIPTILRFPSSAKPNTTVQLTGKQLTGIHVGSTQQDDQMGWGNIPLVRVVNNQSGVVTYCRTFNYEYRGIAPGRISSCDVAIPNLALGDYKAYLVVCGIASEPWDLVITNGPVATERGYNHFAGGGAIINGMV